MLEPVLTIVIIVMTAPYLMVVSPHEGRAANEVICKAHSLVDPGLCGHCTVVATVLDCQPYPGTSQPCATAMTRFHTPKPRSNTRSITGIIHFYAMYARQAQQAQIGTHSIAGMVKVNKAKPSQKVTA